ncbi:unnamed protein product [Diamesa serratosioi]
MTQLNLHFTLVLLLTLLVHGISTKSKFPHHGANISPNQMHSITLTDDVKLTWMVDWADKEVFFQLKNAINEKYNWFAVGFSRRGDFPRTDFCIFQKQHDNDLIDIINVDAWSSEDGKEIIIDHQQDCVNIARSKEDGIAFRRKFDTCDTEDFPFHEGTMFIYWMRGIELLDLDSSGFEVPDVAEIDMGMTHVQILRADSLQIPEKNVQHFDITLKDVEIPSTDTTYWCKIQKLRDTDKKRHIVQFEPIIKNEKFVHHMEIFHCEAGANVEIPLYNGNCDNLPAAAKVCSKVMALWAMGAETFTYPKEVGLGFGGADYNPYIRIEVHFNNPDLIAGTVDNSGMRIKYVEKLRKFDAAVMELGLEYTDKMAIPPGQIAFPLSGYCIAECTKAALPKSGITIFGSQLHTHLRGVRVLTRHFRNGKELQEVNRDDFYFNSFQEIRHLRRKPQVRPGDALVTTCYYDTQGYDNATMGGFSIQDEMCVNYIHYYPATNLELCKSSVSEETLKDYFKFMKEKDHQNIDVAKGRFANYKAINWTLPQVNQLFSIYTNQPLSMQCNKSDGQRYPGANWEGAPVTEVPIQLPQRPDICSRGGRSLADGKCDMMGECIY